jgi:hypothetical protein
LNSTNFYVGVIGVDSMATKEAKKWMKTCAAKKHELKETVLISWGTVSRQAPSIEKNVPCKSIFFLVQTTHFYLAKTSCLHHSHHPHLKSEAISCGKHDMEKSDINLLTLLFSANVQPFQISQIMGQMKGPQARTYSPKHLYNTNKRTDRNTKFCSSIVC